MGRDGEGEGEFRGCQGSHPARGDDTPEWVDGAPTNGRDQSCALCCSWDVAWVHRLASDLVQYRVYGKGHTLPTFWMLCDRCERSYAAGDDEALVRVMKSSDGWFWQTGEDITETVRKPLAVFRRADKGAQKLAD
jgi:hypothetical protein